VTTRGHRSGSDSRDPTEPFFRNRGVARVASARDELSLRHIRYQLVSDDREEMGDLTGADLMAGEALPPRRPVEEPFQCLFAGSVLVTHREHRFARPVHRDACIVTCFVQHEEADVEIG